MIGGSGKEAFQMEEQHVPRREGKWCIQVTASH